MKTKEEKEQELTINFKALKNKVTSYIVKALLIAGSTEEKCTQVVDSVIKEIEFYAKPPGFFKKQPNQGS